jgi:hypothetical protein
MLSIGEVHTSQWIRSKTCTTCEKKKKKEVEHDDQAGMPDRGAQQ